MATVLATLNLMELRLATDKPVRDLIAMAKEETARAAGLLTEVIDAFRAQEDQLPTRFATIDLSEVLLDAVEPFVATTDGSRVSIDFDAQRQLRVTGDARRLSDVFRNLIQNALKYSPQETRVHILLEVEPNAAIVKVVDRGYLLRIRSTSLSRSTAPATPHWMRTAAAGSAWGYTSANRLSRSMRAGYGSMASPAGGRRST